MEIPSSEFKFEAGHFITASIHAYSSTEAELSLLNHNNDKKAYRKLCSSSGALSQEKAVWLVDTPLKKPNSVRNHQIVHFPFFTYIDFTNAFASSKSSDEYYPSGAGSVFVDLVRRDKVRMNVIAEEGKKDTLTIQRKD